MSDQLVAETFDNPRNTYTRQMSMPPVRFEPTISAGERPQTYALDRAATATDIYIYIYIYIQGVTGGTDQTSGGCSLC